MSLSDLIKEKSIYKQWCGLFLELVNHYLVCLGSVVLMGLSRTTSSGCKTVELKKKKSIHSIPKHLQNTPDSIKNKH